jgi:hypothetical protein
MKTIILFAYQLISKKETPFNWNNYTKREIKPAKKHYLEARLERLKELSYKARTEHNRVKCVQAYYLIDLTQQQIAKKSKFKLSYLN